MADHEPQPKFSPATRMGAPANCGWFSKVSGDERNLYVFPIPGAFRLVHLCSSTLAARLIDFLQSNKYIFYIETI